jgi:hypothetical protein
MITREQTIEALRICNNADGDCKKCPFKGVKDCVSKMQKSAIKYLIADDDETTESQASSDTKEHTEIIEEIKKMHKHSAEKKRHYKKNIPLYQYWSGRADAADRIMEMLIRKGAVNDR